jgi:hypothetical protein
MPDDFRILKRDERNLRVRRRAQRVNQRRLVRATKGQLVDPANGGEVCFGFGTNDDQ